jgi:hypothetical protein
VLIIRRITSGTTETIPAGARSVTIELWVRRALAAQVLLATGRAAAAGSGGYARSVYSLTSASCLGGAFHACRSARRCGRRRRRARGSVDPRAFRGSRP